MPSARTYTGFLAFTLMACASAIMSFGLGAQQPHLDGRLTVTPSEGLLDGAMCLTDFKPRHILRFVLGAPLNIKQVADGDGQAIPYDGDYAGRMIGEAREYVVRRPDSLPAFSKVCVEYRGAVPVFETNSATADWKGRIAAINGTIRAAEQGRWYPTLFDSVTTAAEDAVTYRLAVHCATCRSIYVNGAAAVADTVGIFESHTPRTLLLYAGNFTIRRSDVTTFLGGAASDRTATVFTSAIRDIGNYYAKLLDAPYREQPVLLSFRSISRDLHAGQVNWQFVTWPTIAFSGALPFDSMVERRRGEERLPDWLWASLSHEMGHYYFGTVRFPHGPLYWFVLESTAEYLSLKSTGALRGQSAVAARLVGYLAALAPQYPSLATVTDPDQISSSYRYRFAPMALLELERRVGEAKVMAMLRTLLNAPSTEVADYASLLRAATSAGISNAALSESFSVDAVRSSVIARGRETLATESSQGDGSAAVTLAAALVNADTSLAGRLAMLPLLRKLVATDSTNFAALYQIGKIGALTGQELDAARAALETFIAKAPANADPSKADAYWRLGTIAERQGDRDTARAMYDAALRIDPAHAQSKRSLAQLGQGGKPPD